MAAVVVGVNMVVAFRLRPLFHPQSPEQTGLDRYRQAVTPIRTWLVSALAVLLGIFAGTSGAGEWRTYLLWRNGVPFGSEDAYFGKDIGFYVFDLPWYHFLVDFVMAVTVVALLAAAVVHYLYGGIRLQSAGDRLSGAAQAQLSVLLGVFVLAKAVDYWLDRYDLAYQDSGAAHRHHLHRRERGAAGQEHPDGHRDDLRGAVLRQRVAPHLACCRRSASRCSCSRRSCWA